MDGKICNNCYNLALHKTPHNRLNAISVMPCSAVYVCKDCRAFWMQQGISDWDLMNTAPDNEGSEWTNTTSNDLREAI